MTEQSPMVGLPDPRFIRPFQVGSLTYWEVVAKVIQLTGASRDDAESFVQRQRPCIRGDLR